MLPKLIVTDIDGVWTDGSMYYSEIGDELKRFNTADSAGVYFAHFFSIPVAIITGENTKITENRAKKTKVDYVFQNVKNKYNCLLKLINELGISFQDVAYIGDDLNDLKVLKSVGISGAPNNAPDYIKKSCKIITSKNGGEGAFREFVEEILLQNNKLNEALELAEKFFNE